MRVLLDTNVLIAAFIARGTCHEVLEHTVRCHELVLCTHILQEFRDKLRHKFGFTSKEASRAEALLKSRARRVHPEPPALHVDPDDLPVLGAALAGGCHCVVTGDRELQQLGSVGDCAILSPRAFWAWDARD